MALHCRPRGGQLRPRPLSGLLYCGFTPLLGVQRGVLPRPLPGLGPRHRLDLARFHLYYVRPEMHARYAVDPLGFQAPVVDPDVMPGPL